MSEDRKSDESLLESDSESSDRDFLSDSEDDEEHMDEDAGAAGGAGGDGNAEEEDHVDDDDDDDDDEDEGMGESELKKRTYIPSAGDDKVDPEDLDFDETAYIMFHKAESGYPCLSFDIIPDSNHSADRGTTYPQTVYLVAGTQAPVVHKNKLLVMKMSNLSRMKEKKAKNGKDEEEEEEDESADDPALLSAQIPHDGVVNRVRTVTLGATQVAATWSESGRVDVWDLTKQLAAVEDQKTNDLFNKLKKVPKPIFTFKGHQQEGFAMDWSSLSRGYLASGDCSSRIHVWKPLEAFSWHVDVKPLIGHTDSVEDIQWSPTEHNILSSCSVDKSIRVWDIRTGGKGTAIVCMEGAHESDVNVISWNKLDPAFLLSGGDDGTIKTWDLRMCGKAKAGSTAQPVAVFKHHTAPITSLEWHPTDSTVFAASGDDNQITLWDLAVEKDEEEEEEGKGEEGEASGGSSKENEHDDDEAQVDKLPPQLLFIHQGSSEVKELHWHSQIPGLVMSTALNGFDVFRTISV